MCASDTVDGDVLTLVDMKENLVESVTEIVVSVWHVAEVARDPFGFEGILKVKALELLSVICDGLFGLLVDPKQVTTRSTSGNCVGCPCC